MTGTVASGMSLLLELFVDDLAASRDFYQQVLDFAIVSQEANGYTALSNGRAHLALNHRAVSSKHRRADGGADERPGRGVEIVLEVDNIEAVHVGVMAAGWPLIGPLKTQSWGRTDFRLADPDGYRLRVTSRVEPNVQDIANPTAGRCRMPVESRI